MCAIIVNHHISCCKTYLKKKRHTSRQTRLNDIAPLARGTEFADMLRVKELVVAGANAAAELMIVAKKEAVFMIRRVVCALGSSFIVDFGFWNESSFSVLCCHV